MGCCCNRVCGDRETTTFDTLTSQRSNEKADGIPNDIVRGIENAFKAEDDADSLARIIYFLSDCLSKKIEEPFNSLKMVLSDAVNFKKVAERMVEGTKTADKDPQYRQVMHDVWNILMKDMMTENPDGGHRLQLVIPTEYSTFLVSKYCFMRAVQCLPSDSFRAVATYVSEMGGKEAACGETALIYARKAQPVKMDELVETALECIVIANIKRWWNGEITGTGCVKNIIDSGVCVAAGAAGGIGGQMIGASVGSAFGPVGTALGMLAGALSGGYFAKITAESLCSQLTEWVFGLSRSEALENAFNFLDVSPNASNSDVNSQYRRLALKYHPDKGGDAEKWTRLQYSLAVIRESRGES